MAHKLFMILWSVIFLLFLDQAESISCSSNQIQCGSRDQCVSHSYVCDGSHHCLDGSDEDPRICKVRVNIREQETVGMVDVEFSPHGIQPTGFSPRGIQPTGFSPRWIQPTRDSAHTIWRRGSCYNSELNCRGSCKSHKNYCRSSCREQESEMCQLIDSGILYMKAEETTGISWTDGLVEYIQKAVNDTATNTTKYCPMFYTRVGDSCLSFFSPAKIPWPEARQFCLAMGGDLVSLGKSADYLEVQAYMRNSKFTTNYWTGGRFDVDTNNWSWVGDDSTMPQGTPFWATRYKSSCVPRSVYTDLDSLSSPPIGAPCYNYVQAPDKREAGWCASITYEHYYYLTDESCQEHRSPLCVYSGRFGLARIEGPE